MRREAARVGDMQAPLLQDAAEGLEDMEEEEVGGTAAAAAGAPGMRRRRSAYSREDSVVDPVVTRCGHLYCWTCLYRWLHTNHTECPVCKAGVRAETVIPLYVRGSDNVDPRTKEGAPRGSPGAIAEGDGMHIPSRPAAERAQAERPRAQTGQGIGMGPMQFGGVTFTAGFGFFPSLFGLQFQHFTAPVNNRGPLSSEEAQQAFLSRILLMLGSFVVICLLLF